jgi:hypothetical protein
VGKTVTKRLAYFLVDKKTGTTLAAHIHNGPVLQKWKEELEKDGHEIEIQPKEVSDIFDGKVGQ